ncbi:MAG: ABC transporter permease [Thermoanaerobaculia bacterium]
MRSPIWAIMKREYLTRVLTKGFWITTALFPLITAGFTIIPPLLTAKAKASPEPVRVVDTTGDFYPILRDVTEKEDKSAGLVPPLEKEELSGRSLDKARHDLNNLAAKGTIQGYYIIDSKALESGKVVYFARNPSSIIGADMLRANVREAITRYRLMHAGLAPAAVEAATRRIDFDVQKATNDASKKESGITAFFMSFALVMFVYFALIFYGIYVLRGVLEEKSNRIVEVIVSTVKPFQLMMGKIVGIGAVGLTQIAIWLLCAVALTAPQIATMFAISKDFKPAINGTMLAFFPVYFLLGYFLYATIYAGIGSMFNSDEDAQQMAMLPQMLIIIPMMLLMPVLKNPNGTLATVLSLFPFFTPILMYMRIAAQTPPMWQIGLSVVIMLATIFLMIWIVAKIYRVGILMYGKKPTIPELVRWLRYT